MNWPKQLLSRHRLYGDLSEEIREHLEEKMEALERNGMSRKDAVCCSPRVWECDPRGGGRPRRLAVAFP